MSSMKSEIVQLLTFLRPGLVALATFYAFTSHPKPSELERVAHALIFTLVTQALVAILQFTAIRAGMSASWTPTAELIASIIVGAALGLLTVIVVNTDVLHRKLRRLGITQETSYPSCGIRRLSAKKIAMSFFISLANAGYMVGLRSGLTGLMKVTLGSQIRNGW